MKDLEIPKFNGSVDLADTSDAISKAILKRKNHPSTIVMKDFNNTSIFSFSNVSIYDIK